MVPSFLLFDTITNEKTVKFMQRDIITSTITWHLGLVGYNNFGECTSFSPFTLPATMGALCKRRALDSAHEGAVVRSLAGLQLGVLCATAATVNLSLLLEAPRWGEEAPRGPGTIAS